MAKGRPEASLIIWARTSIFTRSIGPRPMVGAASPKAVVAAIAAATSGATKAIFIFI